MPLAWDHWRGATLTLTPKQVRQLEKRAGYEGITRLRIVPGVPKHLAAETESLLRPLHRDERRYTLDMRSGGLAGVGYEVIVAKIAQTWVIKEWRVLWLS